jgi:hypothetical protein
MKKYGRIFKTENVLNFLTIGFSEIISIISFIVSQGLPWSGGKGKCQKPPGSIMNEDFDRCYRQFSSWNSIIPKVNYRNIGFIVELIGF